MKKKLKIVTKKREKQPESENLHHTQTAFYHKKSRSITKSKLLRAACVCAHTHISTQNENIKKKLKIKKTLEHTQFITFKNNQNKHSTIQYIQNENQKKKKTKYVTINGNHFKEK